MLAIRHVSKRFGGLRALRDVNIEAERSCVTGLIGPNGAGKSTLMNVISGFIGADEGSVTVDEAETIGLPPHRMCASGVVRTFQNLQMFSDMSTVEVVVMGRTRHRRASLAANLLMTPAVRHEERDAFLAAQDLLVRMDVPESFWLRRAGDLPYGFQRRVEIARALATEPAYLLLDEPAAGLNDKESSALGETLRKIADGGIGVVLIEHDIDLVMNVSARVFVMDAGTVIASGTPSEVRSNPDVVAAYLGEEHD
ncbi:MAG: ABC transporter ATP-binding protein [Betaproteobacteria bacterium]|nr:ABC transporter ATP-binding protein [Betaproteobacteria bacterium]